MGISGVGWLRAGNFVGRQAWWRVEWNFEGRVESIFEFRSSIFEGVGRGWAECRIFVGNCLTIGQARV